MLVKHTLRRCITSFFRLLYPPPVLKVEITSLAPNELLKGRSALITGGTSGIGYEIARAFMEAGASVIITGRSQQRLTYALKRLSSVAQTNATTIRGEVMDNSQDDLSATAERILASTPIDILVNNAGIIGCGLRDGTPSDWDAVMNANLRGCFFLSRLIARHMIKHKIRGNILNIASSSSMRPACSAYTISKWGIRGLTLGLAKSLAPHGITVNGLAPGPTATPMLIDDERDDLYNPNNPTGRYAHPCEIANMAVLLVSNAGRMIVGDTIFMTGGAGLITFDDMDYTFE